MKSDRIVWIDYAKVLCIYFVTLVHTPIFRPVYDVLCAFIIPMFFFLSGYFFSYERYPDYLAFVKRRVRQLLVPYFSLAFIAYLFWFFVGRHYGDDATQDIVWYSPLAATVLGYGKEMVQSVPLWFVMALFTMEILFWPIGRIFGKRWWTMIVFLVAVGFVDAEYVNVKLPFYINHALVGFVFYALGMCLSRIRNIFCYSWFLFLLGSLALAVSVMNNVHVTFLIEKFGNYWLFLLGGVGGIFAIVMLCYWLAMLFGDLPWVRYIGKNTVVICGLHLVMFTLMKGVMVYVLDIPLTVLDDSVFPCMLFGALSVLCCVPVIYLINRFAPFLLGRW